MCQPRVDREVEEFAILGIWKWVFLSEASGLAVASVLEQCSWINWYTFSWGLLNVISNALHGSEYGPKVVCAVPMCNQRIWISRKWAIVLGMLILVLRSSRVFSQHFQRIKEYVEIQNRETKESNRRKQNRILCGSSHLVRWNFSVREEMFEPHGDREVEDLQLVGMWKWVFPSFDTWIIMDFAWIYDNCFGASFS